MSGRFNRPPAGEPTPVRFPAIARTRLDNDLGVWTIKHTGVPVVSASLLVPHGTGRDPVTAHGLAGLTGDMLDEGAGTRSAIELAEAFGRLGTQLDIDVGPDTTVLSFSALARVFPAALTLMADAVMRPTMAADDFARVRELRVSRLRQLSRSAATMADRAYVSAVFAGHPYGHGALGTTASLEALSVDDARRFWETTFGPAGATLVVCGDVDDAEVARAATAVFGAWSQPPASVRDQAPPALVPDPRVILVSRPGSPQSELRIGHAGPARTTPDYHALVVLNAVVGGQFTSRINRRLREEKGITYGAHTSFDFRVLAGSFSCDSSVQADATGTAVADVLDEFAAARRESVVGDELAAAKASLTRGYVRNFETAGQLGRAAAQLATYGLPDDTFDRFVPRVEAVESPDVLAAAARVIRPDEATVVVVGDPDVCVRSLALLGRPVVELKPEF